MTGTALTAVERYLKTYAGQKLASRYSMDQEGVWRVLGEDPNCDLGGYHYQPDLGTFEGKLGDIIAYAVTLPGFWQWGSGGDFVNVGAPVKIDASSSAKRIAAEQRVKELEAELEKARKELEGL